MADHSAIEWTDTTWNPVTGCDRVSPGCAHCYALELAARLKRMGQPKYQRDGDPKTSGPGFGVTLHERVLDEPLRWRRPRRVFVNSMSDLFHDEVPDDFVARVFAAMGVYGKHTFQVLTKRPERMQELLSDEAWQDDVRHYVTSYTEEGWDLPMQWPSWPLPNVWLGVSIENRRFVHRADLLRQTPAAVRFLSAEPLLGPLIHDGADEVDADGSVIYYWSDGYAGPELDLTDIDWLIVGGESGPGHRQIDPQWVCDLRDACLAPFTEERIAPARDAVAESRGEFPGPLPELRRPAFFFKQWGGAKPTSGGRELDGRTWDEFPTMEALA